MWAWIEHWLHVAFGFHCFLHIISWLKGPLKQALLEYYISTTISYNLIAVPGPFPKHPKKPDPTAFGKKQRPQAIRSRRGGEHRCPADPPSLGEDQRRGGRWHHDAWSELRWVGWFGLGGRSAWWRHTEESKVGVFLWRWFLWRRHCFWLGFHRFFHFLFVDYFLFWGLKSSMSVDEFEVWELQNLFWDVVRLWDITRLCPHRIWQCN